MEKSSIMLNWKKIIWNYKFTLCMIMYEKSNLDSQADIDV